MGDTITESKKAKNKWLVLIYFMLVVIGVGLVLGWLCVPSTWYATLNKPFFNPPNALFAPVWTILYAMIAIAGWRIWIIAPKSLAMMLWGVQMGLNWLWMPVFFLLHHILGALIIILLLLVVILLFIMRAPKHNKMAAQLFIPYAIWVGFATILNATIVMLN